jgi:hypothetical protein
MAVETSSSVSNLGGRSAGRAETQLKSITMVVTGLVERLQAMHADIFHKFNGPVLKLCKLWSS